MRVVTNVVRKSAIYLMIKGWPIFYTKGVVYPFDGIRPMVALQFSPPHTPPLITYQPKKKYLCLSAGNTGITHVGRSHL
jgi:hypothetical protein